MGHANKFSNSNANSAVLLFVYIPSDGTC